MYTITCSFYIMARNLAMTAVELPVRIIHLHANPNPSTRNTEGFSQIVVAVPAVVFGCVCVGGWVSCMLGRG